MGRRQVCVLTQRYPVEGDGEDGRDWWTQPFTIEEIEELEFILGEAITQFCKDHPYDWRNHE